MTNFVTQTRIKTFGAVTVSAVTTFSALIALGTLLAATPLSWLGALPVYAQSSPTLSAGSTGESVSQLQATLKLLGFYSGEITGIYDQPTTSAVAEFQAAAGIFADGVAGPSTWQKLLPAPSDVTAVAPSAPVAAPVATSNPQPAPSNSTSPAQPEQPLGPPVLRKEAEGPAVAQLQRELQTLGYYDGDIDGGFGEQTQLAVEEFQAAERLFVDGVVGAATWNALSRALEGT